MNDIGDYDQHIVCYSVYPKNICDNEHSFNLKEFQNEIMASVQPFLRSYIWHRDKFELTMEGDFTHLKGSVNCEYSIEDEWFIVFLLFEISRRFDVFIRITDTDGEFLLIEAASCLEKWMTPEKCSGRVYIVNGIVHLISPYSMVGRGLEPADAINLIRNDPTLLEANIPITNAIQKKIEGYPEKIEQYKHRARVYVPVKLAALLDAKPELIAAAANALCSDDAKEKNAFDTVKYFERRDCVMHLVTFTRCLYAMLTTNERVMPNVRSNGWFMTKDFEHIEKEYKLGYKIAMGFELLVSSEENQVAVRNAKFLKSYIKRLEEADYFKNNLPGSKEYTRLREDAENRFHRNTTEPLTENSGRVTSLLQSLNYDLEHYRKMEPNLPPSDNDDWLTVTESDLMNMLETQCGIRATSNPSAVSSALSSYLTSKSDAIQDETEENSDIEDDDDTDDDDETDDDDDMDVDKTEGDITFSSNDFFGFIKLQLTNGKLDDQEIESLTKDIWQEFEDKDASSGGDTGILREQTKLRLPTETLKTEEEFQSYMDMMDNELASTTLAESFVTSKKPSNTTEEYDETDAVPVVDVEKNALQNFTVSYEEQVGGPGPAGNILNAVGLRIEKLN